MLRLNTREETAVFLKDRIDDFPVVIRNGKVAIVIFDDRAVITRDTENHIAEPDRHLFGKTARRCIGI